MREDATPRMGGRACYGEGMGKRLGFVALSGLVFVGGCGRFAAPSADDGDARIEDSGGVVEGGGQVDGGDAAVGDAALAPKLRYQLNRCSYCQVQCYPEPKTCAELGIHQGDPCLVRGVTSPKVFELTGTWRPTESCVIERHDRYDAGDAGCGVTEGYLTCGPDDDGSLMSGPYSCARGGVPCTLPPR